MAQRLMLKIIILQGTDHWLQDPSGINRDKLINIRSEFSMHFRNTRGNTWKTKCMSLQRIVTARKTDE
jgi:hypothetical protein